MLRHHFRRPRAVRRARQFLILGLLVPSLGCGTGSAPISLGLAGPFDDPVGAPMLQSARLAVSRINAAGGIRGRPLALIEMNDHGHPDSAVAVAARLRESRAVAVIGHLWSATTLAAGPVYGGGMVPLPMISPSSSAPDVSWLGSHAFRVCPSDDAHGTALADWLMQNLGASRVGVLNLNNEYGRGVRRAFESRFTSQGGEVVGPFPYLDPEDEAGVHLDRVIRAGELDALLVAGYATDTEVILRAARNRGLMMPLAGGDALEGIELAGEVAEGVLLTTAWVPDAQSGLAGEFLRIYAEAYPDDPAPNQPAAATWDAIHLVASLLATTGPDRRRLRTALAGVGTTSQEFPGVTGPIAFTSNGDLIHNSITMTMVRDGRVVRAEQP